MKNSSHSPVWTIAKNTYREIIRDRLLYGVLLIAVLVIAFSFFTGTISLGQDVRVMQNIGVAAIHIFALFICIFVATTSMSKDVERRALYLLFPKPIRRSDYLIGKYLGLIFLLLTTWLILGGLFELGAYFLVSKHLLFGGLINFFYSFLEISFLIAIALLFASFTAPLNAFLYGTAIFIIGHSLGTLRDYVILQNLNSVKWLVDTLYFLLPNLEKFDIRRAVLYNLYPPVHDVLWTVAYWTFYTIVVLWLTIGIIRGREV